jgi:hypothetical protein
LPESPSSEVAKIDRAHTARFSSRLLVPHIPRGELAPLLGIALCGGLLGGIYGAIHDLVTYSISSEYFTKLKYHSFAFANLGLGNHAFAATIGFLASGVVGLFAAWFLARRLLPNQPRARAVRQILQGFTLVFSCVLAAESLGYAYGLWRGPNADYSAWLWAIEKYRIDDHWNFVRVAYIHNSAYLGAAIGLLLALWCIKPSPRSQVHS